MIESGVMSSPGRGFHGPAQRGGTLARMCAIPSKFLPNRPRGLVGAVGPRSLHSARSWDFDPPWWRISKTSRKLVEFCIPRVWPTGCSTVSPKSDGALVPRASNPGEETRHGKDLGRASGHRFVPDAGARHGVRDVGVHAVLPGDRQRRGRRQLTRIDVYRSDSARPRRGGTRPSVVAVTLWLFLGCASSSFAQPETATYRRPIGHDPQALDPARIGDVYGLSVTQQIFDGLVQFDPTLMVSPGLAEFWKASRDGLTWTFTLRKGVRFHHGRELNADDVVYSFTRLLDPALRSGAADLFLSIQGAREFREGRASSVVGLKALDRFTVQVNLTEATVPFVSIAAIGHAKIVPR